MDFAFEEPDLPQHISPEVLDTWRQQRYQADFQKKPPRVKADTKAFLMPCQHQLGLDSQIRRCRQYKERKEELWPKINGNLPFHLQELQIFNPDQLKSATTEVKCTLPDSRVLTQEVLVDEALKQKPYKFGLVLNTKNTENKEIHPAIEERNNLMADIIEQWTR